MRRRPPSEVDPDRLSTLLASARARPEPAGPRGWVPLEGPPIAETSWLDEPAVEDYAELPGEAAADPAGELDRSGSAGGRHRPRPRVLTVPVAFRGARVGVSVRAVVAFLVVLAVAVVFFAVRVARAQQAAAPQPVPAGEGLVGRGSVPSAFATSRGTAPSGGAGPASAASVGDSSLTGGASARGSPGRLFVDVAGQVIRPGVVTVPD
ncbi:MAG: hypothetical protein ABJA74_11535, partial [Lapillicoccus sp.]